MLRPPYPDPGEPRFCARCGRVTAMRPRGGRSRPICRACGWVYYGKNALGAAVLIESDDGLLLLVQRAHEPFRDWWMLPAGFVEYGDSAAATAIREAQEETGLEVELVGLQGLFFGTDDPRDVAHLASYYARVVGGTPAPADDAADLRFFGPDDIPERIAFQGQRDSIQLWIEEKRRARR